MLRIPDTYYGASALTFGLGNLLSSHEELAVAVRLPLGQVAAAKYLHTARQFV
jgi:hypothetical protein